ncbi:MAG TPA: M1 family aminopeptidase [Polyangiaceae bacterium]
MKTAHRQHARCACAGAPAPFALAGTERQYERSRPFTIAHLKLEVDLDMAARGIEAKASLDFERISPDAEQLELDAVGFDLHEVSLASGGKSSRAHYSYDGEKIVLRIPPDMHGGRIDVTYAAKPRRGMYFLEPDSKVKDRPRQVWTQCQDEDARHWLPCHDKPHVKMTTEIVARVPSGFVVLSNGELVEKLEPKGKNQKWTYHYKLDKPHPSYLMTLVAGEFEILEDRAADRGSGSTPVPVRYYVPKGREKEGQRSLGETPRMIELFGRLTGVSYPWSSYSQVVVSDFIFGGMENTSATTLYEYVLLDERAALDVSSNDLVAHELAHQWFGDYVTCRDWSHAWLNEGFATFFEHVERESRLGKDEYEYGIASDLDAYLREANGRYSRPVVCREYAEPIDLFDRHLYEKGGLVLHMLRRELGDDLFWRAIHVYLTRHAGGIVETTDLARAFEEVSGRSFERFFDQWIYRAGHPELKVKISHENGLLSVHVKQSQNTSQTSVFAFELEIEVADKDGARKRHRKSVTTTTDALIVPLEQRPSYVAFDPDLRVTAPVTLDVSTDMLHQQLKHGSSARVRWAAAEALGKRDQSPTVSALGKSLSDEREAWMVRAEAATALGRIRGDESFSWLARSVEAAHPKVRRAVCAALGSFRTAEAARLVTARAKDDQSYLVMSEAARSLGRTRQAGALDTLMKLLDRRSWADVTRAGALDGLAALRDEAAVEPVLERTRYGIPTRGRRAAISALARLSDERKVRQHLEDLLDDNDPHLRIDVVGAFQTLGDVRAKAALRRRLERELDGRVKRRIREALRDMTDGSSPGERQRLNDELETLRGELTELKTRLAKLEATKPGGAKSKAKGGRVTREEPARKSRGRAASSANKARARTNSTPHSPKRRKLLDERGTRTR